ncbi:cobalamin biosynthesis protein CobW [Fodinicurvata fenggangensis]|uniref:cobalamin biosynthesis protein CobW n=1 Tax=Fodinicurvata fenggangensis TaxID=1121830 RepID=UPI000479B47A|nr:cobalamin biosynthesis protein CobW [Fodinicurvata fenggangensis]
MKDLAKIPATVITGFLGSGKTTLIRSLLENAGGRRLALVINEFGDVGVDGEILKGCGVEGCSEDDVLELANGCICCTVADDFLPTIQKLIDRPDPPDHIIIETSGLALPKPLVKAFGWPDVRNRVTVDGVVAVVDGPAVESGIFTSAPAAVQAQRQADPALDHESPLEELFEEQLGCADLVVINKRDLLDEDGYRQVLETTHGYLRAGVPAVAATQGQLDPRVLLGLGAEAEDDLDSRPSHHDGDDDHDHDDFESFVVELGECDSPQGLLDLLTPLSARFGVLRVKGFAVVSGKDMRLVVQGVGPRFQHYYDRDWRAEESRRTRLVVIGEKGLDEPAIRAALAQEQAAA